MKKLVKAYDAAVQYAKYCAKNKFPLLATYKKLNQISKDEAIGIRYLVTIDYLNKSDSIYLPGSYFNKCLEMNPREVRYLLNDKAILYKRCEKYLGRDCIDLRECSEEEKLEYIKKHKKFVGKQNFSERAKKFSLYDTEKQTPEEILKEIENNNQTLLEGYIVQHKEMALIYPHSVNTLRIHTASNGQEVECFIKPKLRMGSNMSVVDANAENGSYRAVLNEDGSVCMAAFMDEMNNVKKADKHHDTNVNFAEVKVPYVKEAIEMVKEAALCFPELPYIGWDVAITQDGPVIVEGNAVSGCFKLYQLINYIYHGVGMKTEMDRMFDYILEGKKTRKNKAGLVKHAKDILEMKTVYLWGGLGERLAAEVIEDRKNMYPEKYTEEYCQKLFACTESDEPTYGFDCSGLIKNYVMGGFANYKYDPKYDLNSYMMLEQSARSGEIAALPEEPGLCLFMPGHVGIYIGNQEVIESTANPKFGDGVVKTKLSDREWTHWFLCPGIEE